MRCSGFRVLTLHVRGFVFSILQSRGFFFILLCRSLSCCLLCPAGRSPPPGGVRKPETHVCRNSRYVCVCVCVNLRYRCKNSRYRCVNLRYTPADAPGSALEPSTPRGSFQDTSSLLLARCLCEHPCPPLINNSSNNAI